MKKVDEFERRSKGVTSNWEDGSNLGRSGRRVGGDWRTKGRSFGGQRLGLGEPLFEAAPSRVRSPQTPTHPSPQKCCLLCLHFRLSASFLAFLLSYCLLESNSKTDSEEDSLTHKSGHNKMVEKKYKNLICCDVGARTSHDMCPCFKFSINYSPKKEKLHSIQNQILFFYQIS